MSVFICGGCKKEIELGRDEVVVCGGCDRMAYCSEECHGAHWELHAADCRPSTWFAETETESIDGKFSLKEGEVDESRRVLPVRIKGSGAENLKLISTRLTPTPKNMDLINDYFDSMRRVITGIKAKAVRLLTKTNVDLVESAEEWRRVFPDSEFSMPAVDAWRRTRAKDDKNETAKDREIAYLIERSKALEDVIRSANVLLGPPMLVTEKEMPRAAQAGRNTPGFMRRRPRGLDEYLAAYPLQALGLEDAWSPETPSLYLNLDWDDEKQVRRYTFGYLTEKGIAKLPSETHREVYRARTAWMAGFRVEIAKLTDLIGLDDIKQSVATFVSRLIAAPVSVESEFMNIAILGEPGTGKTEVARILPQIDYYLGYAPRPYPENTTTLTGKSDWVAPFEGQSAHQSRMKMLSGLGRMIVLDEAYSLVMDDTDGFGRESLAQIVNDLDEFRGLVMMTILGYENGIRELFEYNPGMYRRFPDQWTIAPYTADELREIFFYTAQKFEFGVPESVRTSPDLDELFHLLRNRGLFENRNAGAIRVIMKIYRGRYADRMLRDRGRKFVREARPDITEDLVIEAVAEYAEGMGYVLATGGNSEKSVRFSEDQTEGPAGDTEREPLPKETFPGPRDPVPGSPPKVKRRPPKKRQ